MAYTEENNYKLEVVGVYRIIQIKNTITTKKDGVAVGTRVERDSVNPGELDASNNLVDRDLSGKTQEVQDVAKAVWTSDVKTAWKNQLVAEKNKYGG